jgi:hypothetical protein
MKPLEDKRGPYAKLFSAADISTLFSNIAMIEVMCKDLLKMFEQAASEAPRPADVAVGKAMIAKKIALTASFSAYCANQSKALALFESMKKKASFNAYLQSIRDHQSLRGLGLLDWLIKPVQRVTKYPLLLRELEKYTPENHSDRENTVLAAKAVQELVDQVNSAAKTTESIHHMMRIGDEVGDIPSSLQLKSMQGRYYVTEGKWIKVSHGKHQERFFWLFSDLLMYARPNVTPMRKYTYKGTIVLSKSNYEDLPDGNEFGANAIRITKLDSKKTYIIYCKDAKQKAFWLTNINELKDLGSKGNLAPLMPTIGVAKIVSDAPASGSLGRVGAPGSSSLHSSGSSSHLASSDFTSKAAVSAENAKTNNSLVMWSVAVRIAGWSNEDQSRTLLHECPVKCKPFGKDTDYSFLFSDGWMGTKIKMFKTAQSSKNAVDFKVFIPFELMESFQPRSDTSIEVRFIDPDGKSNKNGSFIIEYESTATQQEVLKLMPSDQIGKVRESLYTKRISHQADANPTPSPSGSPSPLAAGITRSQTSASLSLSTSSLPTHTSSSTPVSSSYGSGARSPGPPIPSGYQNNGGSSSSLASSPPNSNGFSSLSYNGPMSQPASAMGRSTASAPSTPASSLGTSSPLGGPGTSSSSSTGTSSSSTGTSSSSTGTSSSPLATPASSLSRTLPTTPSLSSSAPQASGFPGSGTMRPASAKQAPLNNTPGARKTSPKPTTANVVSGTSFHITSPGSSTAPAPKFTAATQSTPSTPSHPATTSTTPSQTVAFTAGAASATPAAKKVGPPLPKTPTASPAPTSGSPKYPNTASPASMPAKTLQGYQSTSVSAGPPTPTVATATPPTATPKAGLAKSGPIKTPQPVSAQSVSAQPVSTQPKFPAVASPKTSTAPPMPSVPKFTPSATSPPPKGPGKLAAAVKKWPGS